MIEDAYRLRDGLMDLGRALEPFEKTGAEFAPVAIASLREIIAGLALVANTMGHEISRLRYAPPAVTAAIDWAEEEERVQAVLLESQRPGTNLHLLLREQPFSDGGAP